MCEPNLTNAEILAVLQELHDKALVLDKRYDGLGPSDIEDAAKKLGLDLKC